MLATSKSCCVRDENMLNETWREPSIARTGELNSVVGCLGRNHPSPPPPPRMRMTTALDRRSSPTQPATRDTRPERFNTHVSRQRWLELQIFPSFSRTERVSQTEKRFRRGAQGEQIVLLGGPVRQTWRFISLTRSEDLVNFVELPLVDGVPLGECFDGRTPSTLVPLNKNKRGSDSIPERLHRKHPSPVLVSIQIAPDWLL